jgi:hypothetical protein
MMRVWQVHPEKAAITSLDTQPFSIPSNTFRLVESSKTRIDSDIGWRLQEIFLIKENYKGPKTCYNWNNTR